MSSFSFFLLYSLYLSPEWCLSPPAVVLSCNFRFTFSTVWSYFGVYLVSLFLSTKLCTSVLQFFFFLCITSPLSYFPFLISYSPLLNYIFPSLFLNFTHLFAHCPSSSLTCLRPFLLFCFSLLAYLPFSFLDTLQYITKRICPGLHKHTSTSCNVGIDRSALYCTEWWSCSAIVPYFISTILP